MIKDILSGVKDVVVELGSGMTETCKTLSSQANEVFNDIDVKLMGSYEEIEAYEKAKALEAQKETEK